MPLELIETIPVGPLGCNFSLVADPETREALLIDPGDEPDRVLELVSRNGLKVVALVHTHAHLDHIGVSALLSRLTGAPILLHPDDGELYANLQMQGRLFGLELEAPGPVGRGLAHGDRIACGAHALEVLHTPGHTPGSTSLVLPGAQPILFAGDTLFRRSVGRTDLWGGSFEDLSTSIRTHLFALPGSCRVIAGHGEDTTIAEEARLNPFVGSRANPLV